MKILSKSYDGGPDSGVIGYWLIEWKSLFSIVLLHFSPGTRKAFHSHAFWALTLWLRGWVFEEELDGALQEWHQGLVKFTPRHKFHRVIGGPNGAWALSFRGPWAKDWQEFRDQRYTTLGHGRKVLA